jgi:hypothetical protein
LEASGQHYKSDENPAKKWSKYWQQSEDSPIKMTFMKKLKGS